MRLPDSQSRLLPEGTYTFNLHEEPERRKHNSGTPKEFVSILFKFKLTGKGVDNRYHMESLVPWSPEYTRILKALGGKEDDKGNVHLSESINDHDIYNTFFKADIIHEPDKDDPQKKWAKLANIQAENVESDGEEEIPF